MATGDASEDHLGQAGIGEERRREKMLISPPDGKPRRAEVSDVDRALVGSIGISRAGRQRRHDQKYSSERTYHGRMLPATWGCSGGPERW